VSIIKRIPVVSSLFPAQVRDKIYEEREEKGKKHWSQQGAGDAKMNAFVGGEDEAGNRGSRPIAEKFENTTIMFADLAGFTQWSSTRSPEQVFELLEAFYSAFGVCRILDALCFLSIM
jgi:class 3 adenylate cyclase